MRSSILKSCEYIKKNKIEVCIINLIFGFVSKCNSYGTVEGNENVGGLSGYVSDEIMKENSMLLNLKDMIYDKKRDLNQSKSIFEPSFALLWEQSSTKTLLWSNPQSRYNFFS